MRAARAKARREMAIAEKRFAKRSRELFLEEIGATVRSASPFLIALLASDGLTLDDVVGQIVPGYGWPQRPRIPSGNRSWKMRKHAFRHVRAALRADDPFEILSMHGASVDLSSYTSAKVHIVAHSIEVRARLKTVTFSTRFGVLRIALGRCLPDTLAIGCVGRLVEEVVDHASLRGSGWLITDIETSENGATLIVKTGSVAYRMPWAR